MNNPAIQHPDSRFGFSRPVHVLLFFGVVCLYVTLEFLGLEARKYPEACLVVAGFWFLARSTNTVRLSVPVLLMGAAALVLMVSWLHMVFDYPDLARSGPSLEDYLDKFLFIFIALALAGNQKRVLLFIGLVIWLIFLMPWLLGSGLEGLKAGYQGFRQGFGINPIRTGMYFCFALAVATLLWRRATNSRGALRRIRWVIVPVFIAYSAYCLLITQTRAAMLSLVLAFLICLPLFTIISHLTRRKAVGILVAVVVAVGLSGIFFADSNVVRHNIDRLLSEAVVVEQVLEGDLESVPNSSWGLRVQFMVIGAEAFLERPFSGWGYRGSKTVLNEAAAEGRLPKPFTQLHNSYLEAMVDYGIGGLLILLGLFGWVFYRLLHAWKAGAIPGDLFVSLSFFLTFFAVFVAFDGILFQERHGPLLFNIAMGVAVSFIFSHLAGSVRDRACAPQRMTNP